MPHILPSPAFRLAPFMLAALLSLTACQTTKAPKEMTLQEIDAALEQAAHDPAAADKVAASLLVLEQRHMENPEDESVALLYARSLKQAGQRDEAKKILASYVNKPGMKNPHILTEYAALLASMGNNRGAETYARKATQLAPQSGDAYNILGAALDSQGKYKPAEVAFRRALEHWEGNPGLVLNNLGLNLAAQGTMEEALETMEKASSAMPDNQEIERNLRIVRALQFNPMSNEAYMKNAPVPPKKPAS